MYQLVLTSTTLCLILVLIRRSHGSSHTPLKEESRQGGGRTISLVTANAQWFCHRFGTSCVCARGKGDMPSGKSISAQPCRCSNQRRSGSSWGPPRAMCAPSERECWGPIGDSDSLFRLHILLTHSPSQLSPLKEGTDCLYLSKTKPQLPSCTEWGHLRGFRQGKPAGWHSLTSTAPAVSHRRGRVACTLTQNPHDTAAHQAAATSPGGEERLGCIY